MDPITGAAVIGGVANIAGDLFSQSNARETFQHRYQDTVKDMRAAGLNPALAYGQGGGNPQTMNFGDWGSSATSAYQAVAAARQAKAQAAKTEAETSLLNAQRDDIINRTHQSAQMMGWNASSAMWNAMSAEQRKDIITRANKMGLASYDSDLEALLASNRGAVTAAELLRNQLPESRAAAKYYGGVGRFEPYVNGAKSIAEIIQMLRGKPAINYNFGRYR